MELLRPVDHATFSVAGRVLTPTRLVYLMTLLPYHRHTHPGHVLGVPCVTPDTCHIRGQTVPNGDLSPNGDLDP